MDNSLFRQGTSALQDEPEKLEDTLRIIEPWYWLALLGMLIMIVAGAAWSLLGYVSTKTVGSGVIVRTGDLSDIVSLGTGQVVSVNVKVGDSVRANQVVALINEPEMREKIRLTQEALREAESDRDEYLGIKSAADQLQLVSLESETVNAKTELVELRSQGEQLKEQISANQTLQLQGLVTKEEVIEIQNKLVAVNDKSDELQAQLKLYEAQKFVLRTQTQMEAMPAREKVSAIKRDIITLDHQLQLAEQVISPFRGQVTEVKVSAGASITARQSLLTIQPEEQTMELVAFIPTSKVKETFRGMAVQISPSTIKREEFGYMLGTVQYVSDYPLTHAALMRDFQNDMLTSELARSGPVNEVRISLNIDPTTASGFAWSSKHGPNVKLTSGTFCSVQIVTKREHPINLILPFLRSASD
jgi:HlyD family secretion protein